MGTYSWDASEWKRYDEDILKPIVVAAKKTATGDVKTNVTGKVYNTANSIHSTLDPKNISMRESCDFEGKAPSCPIITAFDITGSMGITLLSDLVMNGLDKFVTELYGENSPLPNPHIMFMGIGDIEFDEAPLQVTQFECDQKMVEQLRNIWIEGRGGSNNYESYAVAWHFAAYHTKIDCFDKRQEKGFLFTMGDEMPTAAIRKKDLKYYFPKMHDNNPQSAGVIDVQKCFEDASEKYHVYHFIIKEGQYCARSQSRFERVCEAWKNIMGENAIVVEDYTKLTEIMVNIIRKHVDAGEYSTEVITTNAQEPKEQNGIITF